MQNAALPVLTLAAVDAGMVRTASIAATDTQDGQPQSLHWHEFEIEWEGTDLLLASSIGILLIVVLCMVAPMIPWPDWHWHPPSWYWIRICWYWTNIWWVKLSVMGFLAVVASLLLLLARSSASKGQT